ncbi:hypothetical protein [Hirschia litorea]|uniref:Uncharacterized protein n=1 Tax=Hirschia litorea TaxID=1199156 RepID=A0ABW2IKN8_9PROT
MIQVFKLLLPALIPSWRFFDVIAPSPRIEFWAYDNAQHIEKWEEFRPKQKSISFLNTFLNMFWNPVRNEDLFLVTCAERLMEMPTTHSENVIFECIENEIVRVDSRLNLPKFLQFRLMVISREADVIERRVAYVSEVRQIAGQVGTCP